MTEWIKNKKTVVFERAIETLTFVVGLVVPLVIEESLYKPNMRSVLEVEVEREPVTVLFNRDSETLEFEYPTLENFSRQPTTRVFQG